MSEKQGRWGDLAIGSRKAADGERLVTVTLFGASVSVPAGEFLTLVHGMEVRLASEEAHSGGPPWRVRYVIEAVTGSKVTLTKDDRVLVRVRFSGVGRHDAALWSFIREYDWPAGTTRGEIIAKVEADAEAAVQHQPTTYEVLTTRDIGCVRERVAAGVFQDVGRVPVVPVGALAAGDPTRA